MKIVVADYSIVAAGKQKAETVTVPVLGKLTAII
jgi:hypothetical protein